MQSSAKRVASLVASWSQKAATQRAFSAVAAAAPKTADKAETAAEVSAVPCLARKASRRGLPSRWSLAFARPLCFLFHA